MTLRLFVVWDSSIDEGEGGTCIVAAQSKEHAYRIVSDFNDKDLPWPKNIVEIVVPATPGVVWKMS